MPQPQADRAPWLAGLSVLAVGVHLWGLYRVTGPPSPPWFPNVDKLQHLIGFGLPLWLILVTAQAYAARRGRAVGRGVVVAVAVVFAVHAGISELVQHLFYAGRSGDPYDVLADLVGVGLGVLGFGPVRRRGVRATGVST